MNIKGISRERKRLKRKNAMRVDNGGVRRIQLALLDKHR